MFGSRLVHLVSPLGDVFYECALVLGLDSHLLAAAHDDNEVLAERLAADVEARDLVDSRDGLDGKGLVFGESAPLDDKVPIGCDHVLGVDDALYNEGNQNDARSIDQTRLVPHRPDCRCQGESEEQITAEICF